MEYALNEERPIGNTLLLGGYVLALLGGLLGLFVGNHILTSTVVYRGEKLHKYDACARRHGRIITILAVVMTIGVLILNMALKV